MANINHLEMGDQVKALPEIEVHKSFFGLCNSVIYKPTHSKVLVKQNEYTAEIGTLLKTILESDEETAVELLVKVPNTSANIGNFKLEACISADHEFAAVQLLQFVDFDYKPITSMKTYLGKTAAAFAAIF